MLCVEVYMVSSKPQIPALDITWIICESCTRDITDLISRLICILGFAVEFSVSSSHALSMKWICRSFKGAHERSICPYAVAEGTPSSRAQSPTTTLELGFTQSRSRSLRPSYKLVVRASSSRSVSPYKGLTSHIHGDISVLTSTIPQKQLQAVLIRPPKLAVVICGTVGFNLVHPKEVGSGHQSLSMLMIHTYSGG